MQEQSVITFHKMVWSDFTDENESSCYSKSFKAFFQEQHIQIP